MISCHTEPCVEAFSVLHAKCGSMHPESTWQGMSAPLHSALFVERIDYLQLLNGSQIVAQHSVLKVAETASSRDFVLLLGDCLDNLLAHQAELWQWTKVVASSAPECAMCIANLFVHCCFTEPQIERFGSLTCVLQLLPEPRWVCFKLKLLLSQTRSGAKQDEGTAMAWHCERVWWLTVPERHFSVSLNRAHVTLSRVFFTQWLLTICQNLTELSLVEWQSPVMTITHCSTRLGSTTRMLCLQCF